MPNMKPCPFCGKSAVVTLFHFPTQSCYRLEKVPTNAQVIRTVERNYRTVIYYQRTAYIPQCSDPSCFGRVRKMFDSEESAVNAWNRRKE